MKPGRPSGKRAARFAAALLLVLAALPARAEFWEAPQSMGEGRYPSFFSTRAGPVLVWQESRSTGDTGSAWIRFARYSGGEWKTGRVSDSACPFNSTGIPPILFSSTQSRNGTIAVAIATSTTSIEIRLLRDGDPSFEKAGTIESSAAVVAPRIYPSASGGWLVFAGQGRPSTGIAGGEADTGDQAAGGALALPSSVSIYVSHSADGRTWGGFEPLVSESEQLLVNFAPFSAPLGGRDVVIFQTFILGEGDLRSRSTLMSKTSADGGATWTRARPISDFADPAGGPEAAAENFDNQGAQLALSGGKLWVAWERRRTRTTQVQVWAARIDESGVLDPKTAQAAIASGSFRLSQLIDSGGSPALFALEEKLKANRVLVSTFQDGVWSSEDAELAGRSDPAGAGLVNFVREAEAEGRTFVAWQFDSIDAGANLARGRILAMVPDVKAAPPTLVPLNFAAGKRARPDMVQIRVDLPKDASGVKAFAYIWKKTPDGAGEEALAKAAPGLVDLWKNGVRRAPAEAGLRLPATQDGSWTLWTSIEDNAGNRSPIAALSYYRKRIPPAPPILMPPDRDERGFMPSNSFTLRWIAPEADDIAGYTWDFSPAGPLEPAGSLATATPSRAAAGNPPPAPMPGLTPYETSLVRALGLRIPPPDIRGSATSYSTDNVDNGYYVFSVAAVDTTGNISGVSSILVKADKYRPYTAITFAEPRRDDLGRTVLRLLGRGFLADGRIERVVIDRNGRAPYDIDRTLARSDYRIASDREIVGLTFETDQAGSYRIGLYHSSRGWYWTPPAIAIDTAGTVKYGLTPDLEPAFRLFPGRSHPFTIYDAMVLMAIVFAAVGILLSSRQVVAVVREGELVRREAVALITGGPMPQARTGKAARAVARRGAGLRAKFTFTIAFLVILVVLMLAVILGYSMIIRTSSNLATGLDQRARVLLESVAQGSRYWMGKEGAVTQLGLFPTQTKAMQGAANYITITGVGTDPTVASGEVVYATNDGAITAKLDPATLTAGAYALGKSAFQAKGGNDPLAPLMAAKVGDLRDKAAAAVSDELQIKARLAAEKASLKTGAAGDQRRGEINAELDASDRRIRDKLSALSDQEMDSIPRFDAAGLSSAPGNFLYYKPILEYRPGDTALYRGMVRLEISTAQIVDEVRAATFDLVRLTLIIAAIALGIGIIGAFILSTIIVVPIRKLVAQIERIRDTDNKESLEGSKIEVASRDELYTLADTINQMTDGLVQAAKASKELTVGKGIQKMFIPLSTSAGNAAAKLSTGRIDHEGFEVFGYYEGAKGVSGDYWDFRAINTRYFYFIKCDISGKGVSAALIMVEVATMVINYFGKWSQLFPATIDLTPLAYQINTFINEMKYKGRFAAFTVGVLDAKTGIAYLCDAGDTKLNVWSGLQRRLLTEDLPRSPAAGPFDSSLVELKGPYKQVARPLASGDILMLYTDGIEESKRTLRGKDSSPMVCAEVLDPAAVFAGYLRDYFMDERFQLSELEDAAGSPLLPKEASEGFAASFAAELAFGLAEISTDRISASIRDRAVEASVVTVVSELNRLLESVQGGSGWQAEDATVLAIATGSKAQASLRKSFEESLADLEREVRSAYIVKPQASFMAEAFPERLTQGLSSLGSRLVDELSKVLEQKHHELDKERIAGLLRVEVMSMTEKALATAGLRLRERIASILAELGDERFVTRPEQAPLSAYLRMRTAELGALLAGAIPGPCAPKAVAEMTRIPESPKSMKRFTDKLINSPVYHSHHKVGENNEEFGQDRIAQLIKAVDSRSTYVLVRDHDPLPPGSLSFDFSKCEGTLEEKVIALTAVEKVFRLWRDDATTWRDQILIDEKVDDFLKMHFDQYRLYFAAQRPYYDPEKNNPGYRIYAYLKEDDQYDDLTILAIRRK